MIDKLLKEGDVVWIEGDIEFDDYNVRCSTSATVLMDEAPGETQLYCRLDELGGDHDVCVFVDCEDLHKGNLLPKLNTCPYCGSKNMSIDADLRLRFNFDEETGELDYDGSTLDMCEHVITSLGEIAPEEDMKGYCSECERYSEIESIKDGKGFVFAKIDENIGCPTMDYKYILLREALHKHD